jgi:cytochrome c5
MKIVEALIIGCLAIATTGAIGQMSNASQQPKPEKGSQKSATGNSERGQQVFKQNCYRCHQEPRGFSPSVSGTIARHMRVRAGLSDEDYKALMKFLNP